MKKRLVLLVTMLCAVLMLFSCGKQKDSESPAVTLNVYTSFGEGDGNHETYISLLKQFEEQYDVTVADSSGVSNEEWKNNILSLFGTEEEPDILFFFTGMDGETLIQNGQVVDLETIRSVYPDFASNINTSVLDTMKASDGRNYAVPVSGYWESLFINKDLFEQYQIPIPSDWNSFLETLPLFLENEIIPVAVSLGEIPHYWFEYLIYNHSGPASHLDSVPTDEDILSASWVEGLEDLQMLYQLGAFPQDTLTITNSEAITLFQDKKAAMLLDGSWSVGTITDTEQVILIPFPASTGGPRQSTDMMGGFSMGFYITKSAWEDPQKQKACVDFIKSMSSDESILLFTASGSAPPISTRATQFGNPLLQSISDVNSNSTAYISAVQDTIDASVRKVLFAAIPKIVTGEVTIEDALKEFIELNSQVK